MKPILLVTLLLTLFETRHAAAWQRAAMSVPCAATPGRVAKAFHGEVRAGHSYERRLGRFTVRIRPHDFFLRQHPKDNPNLPPSGGWRLGVYEDPRSDDLSQFTTPFSGPNARDIFPWFDASGGELNAPGPDYTVYFSPEVGRSIRWEDDSEKLLANVERVASYGRGDLDILEYRVGAAKADEAVPFTWIRFVGCLSWPVKQ